MGKDRLNDLKSSLTAVLPNFNLVPRRTTFSSREVGRGSKCAMASERDTRTADD